MNSINKPRLLQEPTVAKPHNSLERFTKVGFPNELLVPCLPFDAEGIVDRDGNLTTGSQGKAPAYWDLGSQCWRGSRWKEGIKSDYFRQQGDRHGVNAGIILGRHKTPFNLITLDLDLACATEAEVSTSVLILDRINRFLVRRFGSVWCRMTRPGRGLVLFRLPQGEHAGAKAILQLHHADKGALGAIEVLAAGEQVVVAGYHAFTKAPITWMRTDRPSDIRFAPDIDEGIPLLPSRAAFNELLEEMLADLATAGITHSRSVATKPKSETAERPRNANQTSTVEKAAPSVKALLSLLRDLPNPPNAGRDDTYLKVLNGTVGCVRGARGLNSINEAEEIAVAHAFALWASCWDAPPGQQAGTYEFELGKFGAELERPGDVYSGWQTLLNVATALGMTDPEGHFKAYEPATEDKPEPTTEDASTGSKSRSRVKFLTLNEIANMPPLEWIIEDLVPAASFVSPYGSPKAGKTFIMLSMLLHVSAGLDWMGRKTKQGAVVYIVGEGARGLKARLEAMREHYDIGEGAPFYVVSRAVNFTKAEAVVDLVEDIRELMLANGQTLAAVAIDTVARAMPGADENAAKEMGGFISCCDHLRERLNCAVFAIHHAGKDTSRGARGSNALLGAVDAEYRIERKDQVTTLTVTDMRDGASGEVLTFDMLKIGTSDGKGSLVPVLREAPTLQRGAPVAKVKLTKNEKQGMSALEETLKVSGWDQSGLRVCNSEDWRAALYSKMAADKPDTKQTAFRRCMRELQEYKLIEVRDPLVWLKPVSGAFDDFSPMPTGELHMLMEALPTAMLPN